jgi:hypothetical protein
MPSNTRLWKCGVRFSAERITCELGIPVAAVPEWIGKRQYPLTHWYLRQYAIDKMGGCVCHPSPSARRVEPSALAPFGAGRSSQPEAIPQPDELAREFRSALAELTTIA